MVWIRIPGLPYRYYTKSLFSHIASSLGTVVRIDYNTSDGSRGKFARLALMVDLEKPLKSGIIVDGKRQVVEYEGLPAICFSCGKYGHTKEVCGLHTAAATEQNIQQEAVPEKEAYGPWMQVSNRRRKPSLTRKDPAPVNAQSGLAERVQGSRYAMLEGLEDGTSGEARKMKKVVEEAAPVHTPSGKSMQAKSVVAPLEGTGQAGNGHIGTSKKGARGSMRKPKEFIPAAAPVPVKSVVVIREGEAKGANDKNLSIASKENVVAKTTTLDGSMHGVVQVFDSPPRPALRERNGRVLPASILSSSVKGGDKNKVAIPGVIRAKLKKKATKSPSQPMLQEMVTSLSSELDHAQGVLVSSLASAGGAVQGHENVDDGQTDMQV
ncbi:hypothetical protein HRI_004581300 [Hibiscus trionum]|uniref:CCHC-type domain-containing protein n=1 Tax=Hibiscus trionum TaxID=183268 RepID=A0A9W7J705_HIBTR|nr:hypothetical protein HRI_004581300 [Hibiscus trionum]